MIRKSQLLMPGTQTQRIATLIIDGERVAGNREGAAFPAVRPLRRDNDAADGPGHRSFAPELS
jgi:hypothetical protein